MERTVMARDVQSILRQNDKILDLNRNIFELIKDYTKKMPDVKEVSASHFRLKRNFFS